MKEQYLDLRPLTLKISPATTTQRTNICVKFHRNTSTTYLASRDISINKHWTDNGRPYEQPENIMALDAYCWWWWCSYLTLDNAQIIPKLTIIIIIYAK